MISTRIKRATTLLTLTLLCIFISGCSALQVYAISNPVSDTQNIEISPIGRLSIDDSILFISSTNYVQIASGEVWLGVRDVKPVPTEQQAFNSYYYDAGNRMTPGFYIIELFVAAGSKPITIVPSDMVLTYRDRKWKPSNSYDLAKAYKATNALSGHSPYLPLCGAPELNYKYTRNPLNTYEGSKIERRKGNLPSKFTLERNNNYCIALEFPINPPNPRDEFRLSVPLMVGDSKIPLSIHFSPGKIEERHQ